MSDREQLRTDTDYGRRQPGVPHTNFPEFEDNKRSPEPGMDQRGRTTTLLITSEFERPMVLSYRGTSGASFTDMELNTPIRLTEMQGRAGTLGQKVTPDKGRNLETSMYRKMEEDQLTGSIDKGYQRIGGRTQRSVDESGNLYDSSETRRKYQKPKESIKDRIWNSVDNVKFLILLRNIQIH